MFSTPAIVLFDTLRIIAAGCSLVIIGVTPFAIRSMSAWQHKVWAVGTALVGTALVGAYLTSLGTVPPAWWRLVAITIGVVLSLIGVVVHVHRGRHES